MRRTALLLVPIALLTALSPATAQDTPPPAPSPDATAAASPVAADPGLLQTLENHRWTLATAIDGEGLRLDALFPETTRPYTLTFTDSILNFQGGCNSFSGAYQITAEGKLEAGGMRSTMMACKPALMQADTALAALLAQPVQIALTRDLQPQLQFRPPRT